MYNFFHYIDISRDSIFFGGRGVKSFVHACSDGISIISLNLCASQMKIRIKKMAEIPWTMNDGAVHL